MDALSLISEYNFFKKTKTFFFLFTASFLLRSPPFLLEAYLSVSNPWMLSREWIDGDLKTSWWPKWAVFKENPDWCPGDVFLLGQVCEGKRKSAWGLKVWLPVSFCVRGWISQSPTFGRVCQSLIISGESSLNDTTFLKGCKKENNL